MLKNKYKTLTEDLQILLALHQTLHNIRAVKTHLLIETSDNIKTRTNNNIQNYHPRNHLELQTSFESDRMRKFQALHIFRILHNHLSSISFKIISLSNEIIRKDIVESRTVWLISHHHSLYLAHRFQAHIQSNRHQQVSKEICLWAISP